MFTVLLKEEVMQQSGKHTPGNGFLKYIAGIKFKMSSNFSKKKKLYFFILYYLNMSWEELQIIKFCFNLHFTKRPNFFGSSIIVTMLLDQVTRLIV